MPHFARIFFIAFASAAASCSSERAQKEEAERTGAPRDHPGSPINEIGADGVKRTVRAPARKAK
jgi:hypothetical protein